MKLIIVGILCLVSFVLADVVEPNNYHHVVKRGLFNIKTNTAKPKTKASPTRMLIDTIKFTITSGLVSEKQLQTLLTTFADTIFASIQDLVRKNNMSSVAVPDTRLDVLPGIPGPVTLVNGKVGDLSTVTKYQNPKISYNATTKTVTFTFFIEFKSLQYTSNYITKAFLIQTKGKVDGTIQNLKGIVSFDLNFDTIQATLYNMKIEDAGKITVHFSGNPLVDGLNNAVTSVLTTVLQPIIVTEIKNTSNKMIKKSLDDLNEALNKALNT